MTEHKVLTFHLNHTFVAHNSQFLNVVSRSKVADFQNRSIDPSIAFSHHAVSKYEVRITNFSISYTLKMVTRDPASLDALWQDGNRR